MNARWLTWPLCGVALLAGCEGRQQKLARLRGEAEASCRESAATKHRLDSAFGYWMNRYPDTLLQVTAAYGDTIEARQNACDAATRAYDEVRREKD